MQRKNIFYFILLLITALSFLQFKQTIKSIKLSQFFFSNTKVSTVSKPTFKRDRWIVVTTINHPTAQIIKLSTIPLFQLLVVGDLKTPSNWSHKNVIYLSIEKQKQLGYRSFQTTPFNAYTRKNIGYLYAIHHGAKYIYDTDDDNAPINDINKYFQTMNTTYGLTFPICNNITVINPYAHFGQPHLWPRGYPLNEINKIHDNNYICKLLNTSSVQQGLVNGDPDVDAIYRLTNSIKNQPIQLEFDSSAPSIQVPIGRLSPYNSQNTFFHYRAFWSLYLPSTVTFRLTDIWRSYWSQRLLWLIGDTLTFHGPNAVQIRNVHSYIKDFVEEIDMYEQTDSLIEFLLNWSCSLTGFYDCMMKLTNDMVDNDYLKSAELDGMRNWIEDLVEIGYAQPEIVDFYRNIRKSECSISISSSKYTLNENQFYVRYSPSFQANSQSVLAMSQMNLSFFVYKKLMNTQFLHQFCKDHLIIDGYNRLKSNTDKLNNITLLCTFNHDPDKYLDNILILKHMYFRFFKNIVFCGANMRNISEYLKQKNNKLFDDLTFIEFESEKGYFHYYCMQKAIEIGFHGNAGIMLISDDFLIKPWNFFHFDHTKIWFAKFGDCFSYDNSDLNIKRIGWFKSINGETAILKTWNEFQNISSPILADYLKTLKENFNSTRTVCYEGSDGFYLPKSKFESFAYLVEIFYKNRVFLEFAVPMILHGLDRTENILMLDGRYYWPLAFQFEHYDNITHFAHPAKLSVLKQNLGQFCNTFIRDILLF